MHMSLYTYIWIEINDKTNHRKIIFHIIQKRVDKQTTKCLYGVKIKLHCDMDRHRLLIFPVSGKAGKALISPLTSTFI